MIYLGEDVIGKDELTKLFVKNSFTKRDEAYYYTSEYLSEGVNLCVKFSHKYDDKRLEIEVLEVYMDGVEENIVVGEAEVENKEQVENALLSFFASIENITHPQSVMMFEGIFELVKDYLEDAYFYADDNGDSSFKNALYGDFMNVFTIQGDVVEDYYEGNLVLTNIKLINNATNGIIKEFDKVNMASNFYIPEDDDVDYMIEAYLESMSKYDIRELFLKAIENKNEGE